MRRKEIDQLMNKLAFMESLTQQARFLENKGSNEWYEESKDGKNITIHIYNNTIEFTKTEFVILGLTGLAEACKDPTKFKTALMNNMMEEE